MLAYAKSLGDHLTVGIDSDSKVKEDKGRSRPYNTQGDRAYILESLESVDKVVIFNNTSELEENIKEIGPDVMVIGSDWHKKTVIGAKHVKKLIFFDRIGEYSTTKILEHGT
jgi:D-beta-D-heptose 7-phosphate kinase/D-beta-D-heptose 1-phosphate adenosyltransferase